jgi:NAD(P)-dependent dehydrogenase (short-subunit alcohol dehydrogenase family)
VAQQVGAGRSVAAGLAGNDIRVNCTNPGLVATDMTARVMQYPEVLPVVLNLIPMKRAGDPDEIARRPSKGTGATARRHAHRAHRGRDRCRTAQDTRAEGT